MTKDVGRQQVRWNSSLASVGFQNFPESLPGERLAAFVQKQLLLIGVFSRIAEVSQIAPLCLRRSHFAQVSFDPFFSCLIQWRDSFFRSFSVAHHKSKR